MLLTCAAKHYCVAKHIAVTRMHKCRKCNQYLHTFCAGQGFMPPNFEATDGKEFDCAFCTGGVLLKMIPAPTAPDENHEEYSEKGVLNQCCNFILYRNCCSNYFIYLSLILLLLHYRCRGVVKRSPYCRVPTSRIISRSISIDLSYCCAPSSCCCFCAPSSCCFCTPSSFYRYQ